MSHNQNQVQNKTMCNAGAQTSPPPPSSYVNTPPKPQNGMSKTPDAGQSSSKWTDRMKGLRATPSEQKLAAHGAAGTDGSVPGSAGSSITAVDAAHGQNHNQSSAGHAHILEEGTPALTL
ncbi:hypothetical protein I317_02059 [Kwoniella heveanensis CBS 569]|nr:hypothetical protein I317_02059 [Kwoniella heveanensis CBS 569]